MKPAISMVYNPCFDKFMHYNFDRSSFINKEKHFKSLLSFPSTSHYNSFKIKKGKLFLAFLFSKKCFKTLLIEFTFSIINVTPRW